MINKLKLINGYCNDQLNLDYDYSYSELSVLMRLDSNGLHKSTILGLSDRSKCELYECNVNNNKFDYIKLHGIILSSFKTSRYIFNVSRLGHKLICQNVEIFYCDDHKKYYTVKPYYLGDYYICADYSKFSPEIDDEYRIYECVYNSSTRIISPQYYSSGSRLHVYHFTNYENAVRAKKIINKNPNLFCQLYGDKEINMIPPSIQ